MLDPRQLAGARPCIKSKNLTSSVLILLLVAQYSLSVIWESPESFSLSLIQLFFEGTNLNLGPGVNSRSRWSTAPKDMIQFRSCSFTPALTLSQQHNVLSSRTEICNISLPNSDSSTSPVWENQALNKSYVLNNTETAVDGL